MEELNILIADESLETNVLGTAPVRGIDSGNSAEFRVNFFQLFRLFEILIKIHFQAILLNPTKFRRNFLF
jgi:hypothetical protein